MQLRSAQTLAIGVIVGAVIGSAAAPALAHEASHLIDGSTIKDHTITGDKLAANTVTGSQIKESTLGTVPSAASIPALTWHPITTFANGWGNLGTNSRPAAWAIDAQGIVHLRGTISGGLSNQTAFTLPASILPKGVQLNLTVGLYDGNSTLLDISKGSAYPQSDAEAGNSDPADGVELEGVTFASAD